MASNKQCLITKFWKPSTTTASDKPYFEYLFEKEEAERKKREEEEERRIKEEEERDWQEYEADLRQRIEDRQRRKESDKLLKEEDQKLRRLRESRKGEGREIIPGLFLGSRLAALNYEWLKDNVKYILNVTGDLQNYYEEENEFVYMRVPVQDSYEAALNTHFEETAKFIQRALDEYAATPEPVVNTTSTTQPEEGKNDTVVTDIKEEKTEEPVAVPTTSDTAAAETATDSTAPETATTTTPVEEKPTNKKLGILIHCREGLSRSPTVVISYLVGWAKSQQSDKTFTLDEAYNTVLEKNGGVLRINNGFLAQLMAFEKKIHNENSADFFDKKSRRGTKPSLVSGKRFRKNQADTTETPEENSDTPSEENTGELIEEETKSPITRRRLRKVVQVEKPAEDNTLDDIFGDSQPSEDTTKKVDEVTDSGTTPMEEETSTATTVEPTPAQPEAPKLADSTDEGKQELPQSEEQETSSEAPKKRKAQTMENKENEPSQDTNVKSSSEEQSAKETKRKKVNNKSSETKAAQSPKKKGNTDTKSAQKNTLFNYFKGN